MLYQLRIMIMFHYVVVFCKNSGNSHQHLSTSASVVVTVKCSCNVHSQLDYGDIIFDQFIQWSLPQKTWRTSIRFGKPKG